MAAYGMILSEVDIAFTNIRAREYPVCMH